MPLDPEARAWRCLTCDVLWWDADGVCFCCGRPGTLMACTLITYNDEESVTT